MGVFMNKFVKIFMLLIVLLVFATQGFSENTKRAQTGMKFLSVATDARMCALSNAVTSLINNSSTALFFNPSAMANPDWQTDFSFGQTQWFADINYVYGSVAYRPALGQYGVFGITLVSVDYGDFLGTIRSDNEQGFLETGIFNPTAYSVGFGYAKALSSKFSVGGHIRYVFQDLGGGVTEFDGDESVKAKDFQEDVVAFDFGLLYKTGFKSLNFGMNVHNFSQEVEYIQESFQLPLTFEMGVSMDVLDLTKINKNLHSLFISIDAVHPRDYYEQLDFGLEYIFLKTFALRIGYTTPTDEQGVSLGIGLKPKISNYQINMDYAYTDFGLLKDIHRFTFKFSL